MLEMRGSPHLRKQLPVRHHQPELLGEAGEQAEFQWREVDLHAIAGRQPLFEVDPHRAEPKDLSRRRARPMAKRNADAGEELPYAERLGEIVVRSGIERLDLRAFL